MTDTDRVTAGPMDGWDEFVGAIQSLEDQAHRRGLHATAHSLNAAKNTAGWEQVQLLERIQTKSGGVNG